MRLPRLRRIGAFAPGGPWLPSLAPRDRRTLLGGVLGIGGILLFGKGVPALGRWQAASVAEATEAREQLAAARGGTAAFSILRDSTRERTRRFDARRSALLAAQTAEAAASVLAELAEAIAADAGVDVLTISLKPDSTARVGAGLTRAGVRLSAEADVQGLADFLYEIESHAAPLTVRELSLTQSDALAPASRMEALRFDVLIETLAHVAPRKSPSAKGAVRTRVR